MLHLKRSLTCQTQHDMADLKQNKREEDKIKNSQWMKNWRNRKLLENEDLYRELEKARVKATRNKRRDENQSLYRENLRSQMKKFRDSEKSLDDETYRGKLRTQVKHFREMQKELYINTLKENQKRKIFARKCFMKKK